MTLFSGDKIEPFKVTDHSGKEWKFPDDFKGGKTAIFFLRHLGCPLCKEKVAELKGAAAKFEDKSVKLIVVVQSSPKRCAGRRPG